RASCPRTATHQRRHARTHERAELAVNVEPTARRQGQPAPYFDVVLQEHARHVERVRKGGLVSGSERRPLEGAAGGPGLTRGAPTSGQLGKQRVLCVVLRLIAEKMILRLPRRRQASRQYVSPRDWRVSDESAVEAHGIERLAKRRSRRRQHCRFHCPASEQMPLTSETRIANSAMNSARRIGTNAIRSCPRC